MPILQRDLERLVSSARASDALTADALARLAALKQAQDQLRRAWLDYRQQRASITDVKEAIQRILEV